MGFLDSRLYRWLEVFTNFFVLNLLWLLACVPVLTIYPATAAMFGVVRGWVRNTDTGGGVVRAFFSRFVENFKQSLGVGALWTLAGVLLILDFYVAHQMAAALRIVLDFVLFVVALLYVLTWVFVFPVMVHYDTGWRGVLKNSLLLSVGQLPTTVLCLLIVVAMAGISLFVPFALLISGSVTAYAVYRLCDRAFQRVARPPGGSNFGRSNGRRGAARRR
jgi:uncharacterized membrane protein YesL